jgi:hypothetical protein
MQASMGYDQLLPLPAEFERPLPAAFESVSTMDDTVGPGGHSIEEAGGKWTMKQAVDALVNEMHDLELEFCEQEGWREVLNESKVVFEPDANESGIF